MASWTLVETLATSQYNSCWNAVYDDNDELYFVQYIGGSYWPYRYVVSTDTLTQIGDATSFGGNDLNGGESVNALAYFKDDLYCTVNAGSSVYEVYRYDGAGVAWTLVAQWTFVGISAANPKIATDGSQLVFILNGSGINVDPELWPTVKYTSNGTSWNTGSISLDPDIPAGAYNGGDISFMGVNFTRLGLHILVEGYYGVWPFSSRWFFHICSWDGAQFNTVVWYDSVPSGESWIPSRYEGCDRRFWRGWYDYSLDLSAWTSMDDSDIWPRRQFGVGYSVGDDNGDWYYTNTAQWGAGETVRGAGGYLVQMFRFTATGEMVAIWGTGSGGSATRYIYTRDDPLEPPSPPASDFARFYHGEGILEEKFLLPFTGILPGAMTIDKSLGTVVIGSDTPNEHMIIYSRHPYSSYDDTDDGFPTGSSISSLKWI